MAFSYTSDDLVASIRTRGRVPNSQTAYTSAKLLTMCDEEIALGLLPQLLSVRQNYYLAEKSYSVVSGTSEYKIPSRAIGMKLEGVFIVDNSGNEYPVPMIAYEDRGVYVNGNTTEPVFYVKNNSVVLVPTPNTTGQYTLRLPYFLRPSSLILEAAAGKITSINTSTNQVTVSSLPSTIANGAVIDFVKHDGGFECLAIDQTITGAASTTLTFASLPSDLAVDDYVCLAGETPIPQLPAELHPVLLLRVLVTVLGSMGFTNDVKLAQAKLQEAEKNSMILITPRSDTSAKKINNRNGVLRQRSSGPY